MDRLFVPLTKESFEDFDKGKTWEVRRMERQWTPRNVYPGRRVTLSCGYSGSRIEGKIGRVLIGSLKQIFESVSLSAVEPRAKSKTEAVRMNAVLLGKSKTYIAFQTV